MADSTQDRTDVAEVANAGDLRLQLKRLSNALQRCDGESRNSAQAQHALLAALRALSQFAEFSLRAKELELLVRRFIEEGGDFGRIDAGIRAILGHDAVRTPAVRHAGAMSGMPGERLIYLVHDNAVVARDMMAQLQYFGYNVVVISELERLQESIERCIPEAVLMDLGSPAGIHAGVAEMARIRKTYGHRFAMIFISTRSNFGTRLAAVRAGADSYFCKPLDMVALIDRLDALIVREERQPYRILVIESNAESAERHAAILHEAGMEVQVLYKLADMLHTLHVFRPELVLMGVHMPDCDGNDLAKLIRSDTAYLDVPIVFLSNEGDFEKQLDAIESGADDFLMMPIKPAHLIAAISGRSKRYRDLRSLIMRDSLTGLFNHSAVKEQLVREISRARREAVPLALSMIDIDRFKLINDTHGHPAGDQVIRALSRLLQQRLRRSDIIGRYGGEEFAVIMPHTPAAIAYNVLDQIREAFSAVRHHHGQKDFATTFSAGIAEIGADTDAETLFANADAALYVAKNGGRNRVVVG